MGRSAPPRVVGARRPMPSWPTAVCPCGPSGSASPYGRLRGGPGVRSNLALSPFRGFVPQRPGAIPRLPASSLVTARTRPSHGGSGAGSAHSGLIAVGVWGVIWAALSVWSVMVSISSLVVLWGRSPGLLNPTLTPAAFPLARAQGWVYPCVLMHVSCARLSPCGWTCVSGCGHVCVCPSSLFCCPPAVFVSRWKTFPFSMCPLVCWPASVSARHTVVCVPRLLSVGFLFDDLVPSHCRIPSVSGAAYCRPVGFLAGTPQVTTGKVRWDLLTFGTVVDHSLMYNHLQITFGCNRTCPDTPLTFE
jgi:hypothetical protein